MICIKILAETPEEAAEVVARLDDLRIATRRRDLERVDPRPHLVAVPARAEDAS